MLEQGRPLKEIDQNLHARRGTILIALRGLLRVSHHFYMKALLASAFL